MSKAARYFLSFVALTVLLTDVIFVVWATKLNFMIVVPVLLSACYLAYLVVYYLASDREKSAKN